MLDKELQDLLLKDIRVWIEQDSELKKVETFAQAKIPSAHKGLRLMFADGSIFQLLILIEKLSNQTYKDYTST